MIQTECIYSNIVEVGKKENIQRIVDALQEMQMVMKEIAGQIQSGGFSLTIVVIRNCKMIIWCLRLHWWT